MRRIAPLTLLILLTAGCSGSDAAAPATPTVPLEKSSPATSPIPTSPLPAAVGTKQETRDSDSLATVTAVRIRFLQPAAENLARAGYRYLGVDAKVCVVENTAAEQITVSSAPWMLSFTDDTTAEATVVSSGWFNVPIYPQDRMVRSGTCVRGWIPFEIPKDSTVRTLHYQPGSGNALEWRVK